jgi:hypothetical protein
MVVDLHELAAYSSVKNTRKNIGQETGCLPNYSGQGREEQILSLFLIEPRISGNPVRSLITILTELF